MGPYRPSTGKSVAYVNANAYTVNIAQPWAGGFIVSPDGVFTHVGDSNEILNIAKASRLTIINLRNQFVMPGIHDAHVHLLYTGMGIVGDADIGMNTTSADIGATVQSASCHCHVLHAYQDWILANMYNNSGFPGGKPDRKYLDEHFPDTPVIVLGGAGHSRLLNTKALKLAGYDLENEPEVQGGKLFRRPDGTLTGEVADMSYNKAAIAYTRPTIDTVKMALLASMRVAHSVGVTSLQEATANTVALHALRELEAEKKLKMNIFPHIVYKSEWAASESEASLNKLIATARDYNSEHVDSRFVKIILDGVPQAPIFTHSTLDQDGTINMRYVQVPDIMEAMKRFDEMGLTVKIHATGDGGVRLALNAIEAVRKNNPNGPRHEIAHNNMVHPDDYKRYKPLNAVAEMSPAFLFATPPDFNKTFDWERMLDNDVFMTIGSDWGAGPDPNLMEPLAFIVERIGRGSKATGGEALVRMITLQSAQHLGRDKEVGSIEVSKKANFIVVDKDLSKGEFAGAVVQRTYFEGELVYDKNWP